MEGPIEQREVLLLNQELPSPCKMQQSISSLNSPVDSGVQLLDSESDQTDQTSVMSSSGCDLDMDIKNTDDCVAQDAEAAMKELCSNIQDKLMTKSDIANQNTGSNLPGGTKANAATVLPTRQQSTPTHSLIEATTKDDIMNISLNSYELLDYTMANQIKANFEELDQMHVSLSEEVNETLRLQLQSAVENLVEVEPTIEEPPAPEAVIEDKPVDTIVDEQIVFRRQRKKKSRSDTPKKRVSFHEDILNSTKIDDIHINHGFITIEPEGSTNFLLRGFKKKHDIVQGRYSWAAEGDSTYNENNPMCNREVQSDIYVQHQHRLSSVSSSSSASFSSSIDEERIDEVTDKPGSEKKPKGSCLKKTKHRKVIDTNIVEEISASKGRKKSETNLLDANIFGSLKNILTFSTSLPLTERGVPEGQEDLIYSTSEVSCGIDTSDLTEQKKKANVQMDIAKNNLKLTIQPMYQNNLPENVILCDSNVYEHKGISYSYEYDNFTKSFEHNNQKPKNSSIYQKILKEFNFFRKKAQEETGTEKEAKDDFVVVNDGATTEATATDKQESKHSKKNVETDTINKYARNVNMDWSDTESVSTESLVNSSMRHLNSPRRRVHRANHYTVQPVINSSEPSKNARTPGGAGSSSKNSLINRFLRHVTTHKMLDMKLQRKLSRSKRQLAVPISALHLERCVKENRKLNRSIDEEILQAKRMNFAGKSVKSTNKQHSYAMLNELNVIGVFPLSSAYTTTGTHKSLLLVITDSTLFVYERQAEQGRALMLLPYTQLNTIIIGPSAQTIHISTNNNDKQCMLITGSSNITNDIMIQLEMVMRGNKEKILPAIKQLTMMDMRNLRKFVSKQTPVHKDDEYFYCTILNAQEQQTENVDAFFGPNKEGPLMFKLSDTDSRWETAYFIMKAGILYMLSSPSNPEPMRVYPLLNGACHGAKRVHNCARPHTFQLILSGSVLFLAAPDEYVASEWLQALIHAATGVYSSRDRSVAPATSLLMTSEQIILVREAFSCNLLSNDEEHNPIKGPQVLSCAAISDLTSFKLPSAEQSWCILEFACREVRETSGDWILYFPTNSELENFISTLEMLWIYNNEGDSFPLTTMAEGDDVNKKCTVVNDALQKLWL